MGFRPVGRAAGRARLALCPVLAAAVLVLPHPAEAQSCIVTTPIGPGNDVGTALAIQTDGKIVLAGYSSNGADDQFAVARYNTNFTLDRSFDFDGVVTTNISAGQDRAEAMALQTDGKIVVAGHRNSGGGNDDFALVRYNTDGSLDTLFNVTGIVSTAITGGNDEIEGVAIQSDGKFVVAGWSQRATLDYVVARYNTNGSLDTAGFNAPTGYFISTNGATDFTRVLQVGFQGDLKKAQLELAPLRWNGARGALVLARRLTVHVSFQGVEADRHRESAGHRGGEVLARLVTTEAGLHEVPYAALLRRGRGVEAGALSLSRQGKPVAFHVEPEKARFAPGSKLYFLADDPKKNPYGHELVYELALERGGVVMDLGSAAPDGEEISSYFETEDYEENRLYQAGLVDAPDLWLWDVLLAPVTKSFAFDVKEMAPGSSRLVVWLQGVSDLASDPDHHVRVYVNDIFQDELWWNGKEPRTAALDLPPGTLREGGNLLRIENVGDTEASYSMVMLDRFQVVHPRRTLAEGGRLQGSFSQSGSALVSGLGASFLLDTTGEKPRWLSGAEVSPEGALRFRAESGRNYLAVPRDAVGHPLIRFAAPARLKKETLSADYLVIGPSAFSPEAAPLLAHRGRQGLKVKFASVTDIYSEFGFGEPRPEAIRDFLSYAYHHWREPKLRYVLLLGDATYDFKDYLRTGVLSQVPPLLVKTSFLWTASDPAFAAVHGEDILPDFAIGRLPAASAVELRAMVSKILAYEQGEAGLDGLLVLATDNSDRAGDFVGNADEIARGVLAGRPVRRLHLNELGSSMRGEILKAFDEGASLVSYIGHGGIHLWADENVFNTSDVASLAPQPKQPLLLTMNCLNGYFHFPYFDSLAEELLKAAGRGAIAAFSRSGLSLDAPAHLFHQALLDEVFHQGHPRLGDAVLKAQGDYAATGAFPELLSIYHLLGDPALLLR